MSKRKLSLRRLFSNTKFLVLFSIVVAIIFWIVVALEYAPVVENVIEGVPVQLSMKNSVPDKLGLQVFGQKDYTVDITVKGNRYVVGGKLLTADDFEVTAQTAYVSTAGNHTLQLKITTKDADANYEIVDTSVDYIEVYFDKYEEKEFEVSPKIFSKVENMTADGYTFDEKDIILSKPTVTLSGAQTEIDKVKAVYANINVEKQLTESITYDSELVIDNGTDLEAKYININGDDTLTLPVTLPVYKIDTLPVSVAFKNSPSDYINSPLAYTCSPTSAKVAVLQNGSMSDTEIEIGIIDFANITNTVNTFTFNASEISGIKVLDGTTSFKVTVNAPNIDSAKFNLNKSNISVTGIDENKKVSVDISSTGQINAVGSKQNISALNSDLLYGKIDLTDVTLQNGSNKVPITVTIKDSTSCWVSGTYYAFVSVE